MLAETTVLKGVPTLFCWFHERLLQPMIVLCLGRSGHLRCFSVVPTGFEPATSGLQGRCSNLTELRVRALFHLSMRFGFYVCGIEQRQKAWVVSLTPRLLHSGR